MVKEKKRRKEGRERGKIEEGEKKRKGKKEKNEKGEKKGREGEIRKEANRQAGIRCHVVLGLWPAQQAAE